MDYTIARPGLCRGIDSVPILHLQLASFPAGPSHGLETKLSYEIPAPVCLSHNFLHV